VDGYDAAYKLAILSAIAFGHRVELSHVQRQGIRRVSARDIEYARELGYTIKLLAVGMEDASGRMEMRVNPAFIRNDHPLASVNDAFNAIFVEGDAVGPVMFFGRGAGADPTASAVVGDIIEIARNIRNGSTGRIHCICDDDAKIKPPEEYEARYYLRMSVMDRPGVIAQIAGVLGNENVSIASVVQKSTHGKRAEIVWITHTVKQREMDRSLKGIRSLPSVKQVSSVIRVEEDE
jgi:homoserine dehydrogenase